MDTVIEGTIIIDLPLQEGVSKTGNNWKKKEWVLETHSNFPRKVKFTVFGERRIAEMPFEMGKAYRLTIDLESREYNGRWYTDVNVLSAVPIDSAMPMPGSAPAPFGGQSAPASAPAAPVDPFPGATDETDDLPF